MNWLQWILVQNMITQGLIDLGFYLTVCLSLIFLLWLVFYILEQVVNTEQRK